MERAPQNLVDVVIVGYGPVGATAANLLGQQGLDVVVVERDPEPYARARAISTDEDVLRCWQHAGLADDLKADMLGGRPIDFVDAKGRSFLSFAPQSRGNGHPTQMFIYQPALEATIRTGAERFPNVEILLEREAGRVRQDPEGVALEVRDLRDGTRSTIRGRYLLACDGGSSPIRTQLQIGFEGRTYEDPWVVVDTKVKKEWPEVDRLRFHCDPKRPAVDCPTPLGHHRWEFPILPGEDRDEVSSEPAIWRMLSRYGITDEHVTLLRRAVYVHHVRFAETWRDRRIFLLGDAAHCMPPWIGQGMASGVRDADNLSWKLGAVLRGRASDALLDSYETERQPHVRRLTQAAVMVGRVITERHAPAAAIRNRVSRIVMRTPLVSSYIKDATWLAMPEYRQGFIDPHVSSSLVGTRIPQPQVVDHTGRRALLDDVLYGGWSVLLRPLGHEKTAEAVRAWEALGARTFVLVDHAAGEPGELRDDDDLLRRALDRANVDALVLRPDAFVYTAARVGEPLAGPPVSLARPAVIDDETLSAAKVGEQVLAALAGKLDDRALERVLGHRLALTAIFRELAAAFVPRVANGFVGEIQYDLQSARGTVRSFTVQVTRSAARARAGAARSPALTIRVRTADFLRLAAGELTELDLMRARRIDLQGDALLGARMSAMFGRPAPVDEYVRPTTVDPPARPAPVRDLQEA